MYTAPTQTQPLVNYPAGTVPFALDILVPPEYAQYANTIANIAITSIQEARAVNGLRMAMFNDMAVNGFNNQAFKLLVENILFYMRMMAQAQGGQTAVAYLIAAAVRAMTELTACQYIARPECNGRLDSVTLTSAANINEQNKTIWSSLAQLKGQMASAPQTYQVAGVPALAPMTQPAATAAALFGQPAAAAAPATPVPNVTPVNATALPVTTFNSVSPMDQSLPVPNEDHSAAPRISQKAIATEYDIAQLVGSKLGVRHQTAVFATVRPLVGGKAIMPPYVEQLYNANDWIAFDVYQRPGDPINAAIPPVWYEFKEDHMDLDKNALLGIPDTKPALAAPVKATRIGSLERISQLEAEIDQITEASKKEDPPSRFRFISSTTAIVVGSHQQAWQMLECAGNVAQASGASISVIGRTAVLHEIISSQTPVRSLITQLCAQRHLKDVALLLKAESEKITNGEASAIGQNAFTRIHTRLTAALSDLYLRSLALPLAAESFINDADEMEVRLVEIGGTVLKAYADKISSGWLESVLNVGSEEFSAAIISSVLDDNDLFEENPSGAPDIVVLSKPMYYMHVGLSSEHIGVEFDPNGVSRAVNSTMCRLLYRVCSYAVAQLKRAGAMNALVRFQDGLTIDVRPSAVDPTVILASLA